MNATIQSVQTLLDDNLQRAGAADAVPQGTRRVIDQPDGFFAELAVTDAAKRPIVEEAVKRAQSELQKNNIDLQVLVRVLWRVEEVRYVGRTSGNSTEGALTVTASLMSGNDRIDVFVHFTLDALDVVREKLGNQFLGDIGWHPNRGDIGVGYLKCVVRAFLEEELRYGGDAYWNPVTNRERGLDGGTLSSLLGQGTAFRDLRNAIDDAFNEYNLKRFLDEQASRRIDPKNFDQVLPDLSSFFGGPYKRGDRFETSAVDLYHRLRPAEQALIRCHYEQVVASKLRSGS